MLFRFCFISVLWIIYMANKIGNPQIKHEYLDH